MRVHGADAAAPEDVALHAEHREVRRVDVRTSASSPVCDVQRADGELPALPVSRPPAWIGIDAAPSRPMRRLKNSYGVSPIAGAERRLAAPGERERSPGPSRKKSRFSGKNRLKRVRFTCCSSTSTCAKSVLSVKSAVRFCVTPYFASTPSARRVVRRRGGVAVLSVASREMRVRLQLEVAAAATAPRGRPASPADDTFRMPRNVVSARGICVRCDHSFFQRTTRRRLMPQV